MSIEVSKSQSLWLPGWWFWVSNDSNVSLALFSNEESKELPTLFSMIPSMKGRIPETPKGWCFSPSLSPKKSFLEGGAIQICVAFHSIIPSMELTFGKHSGDPEQINFQGVSATFESTDAQIAASTTNYCASKAPKTDPTKDFCNCILYFFSANNISDIRQFKCPFRLSKRKHVSCLKPPGYTRVHWSHPNFPPPKIPLAAMAGKASPKIPSTGIWQGNIEETSFWQNFGQRDVLDWGWLP